MNHAITTHFTQTRRQFERVNMAIQIVLGRHALVAHDWSVGGFRVPEAEPPQIDDEDIPVGLMIDCGQYEFTFKLSARRVYHDSTLHLSGFQFVGMMDTQLDMLRAIVVSRVSGDAFPLEEIVVNPHNIEALAIAHRDGSFEAFGLGYTIDRIAQLAD